MCNMEVKNISQLYSLSYCISLIVQLITNNSVKSLFSMNVEYIFESPVVRYAYEQPWFQENGLDIEPDVYIADLEHIDMSNIIEGLSKNVQKKNAKLLLLSNESENMFEHETIPVYMSGVTLIDSNSLAPLCIPLLTQKVGGLNPDISKIFQDVKLAEWRETKVAPMVFRICATYQPPYIICPNCTRQQKGFSVDVTEMIFEQMKISMEYVNIFKLYLVDHYDHLSKGSCDVIETYISLTTDVPHIFKLDIGYPIILDYDVWMIPRPGDLPKWKYLVKVFSIDLWISWTVSISFACLVWGVMDSLVEEVISSRIRYIFFNFPGRIQTITKIFLEQSVVLKIVHAFQLILFASILFLVFMMNILYKGRFTYLLLGPNYMQNDIKTFQDIMDYKFHLLHAFFRNSDISYDYPDFMRYSHLYSLPHNKDWLHRVAYDRDTAMLKSHIEFKYFGKKFLDKDGRSLIQPLLSTRMDIARGSVFLKNNPHLSMINKCLTRLRDHGFVANILSKYESKEMDEIKTGSDNNQKLSVGHVMGPIAILVIGMSTAFLVFLKEKNFFQQ